MDGYRGRNGGRHCVLSSRWRCTARPKPCSFTKRERTGNRETTPGSSRELRLRKRLHALGSEHDSLPNSCNPLVRTVRIPAIQRRSQRPGWDANLHNGKRTEIKAIVSSLLRRVGDQEFSDSESNESRN